MESIKSPQEEKNGSPSQGNLDHIQSLKREVESLEDFEDITKDIPSMKDVTAQFLQHETREHKKPQPDKYEFESDEYFGNKPEKDDDMPSLLPSNPTEDFKVNEGTKDNDDADHFMGGQNFTPDQQQDVVNNLIRFEKGDLDVTNMEDKESHQPKTQPDSPKQPIVFILDENKLVDVVSNDEISTESDDLSFIPKKGESSPALCTDQDKDLPKKTLSECISNEATDLSNNSQMLSKFTSEMGMSREQEPETLQGDGLHVKDNNEGDLSDNEDYVPDPIPKDYPEIGAIEGKEFLAAIGLDTWFHPDLLNPKIESLVYWRDPKKSGVVFGCVLVILLSLTSFSLISVIAYTSLTVLAAALAFRIYKNVLQAVQKTSEGHPFKEYLEVDLTVNPEKAREVADVVVSHVNNALTKFRRLFLVEDIIDSIKFGVILWCLTYVGAWFNGLSLLIIGFVGLFTLPKVYENNKTQIDANLDIVKSKINEFTEKIKAVSPLGKKAEEANKDKAE